MHSNMFRARNMHSSSFTSMLENGVRVNSAKTLASPAATARQTFLCVSVRAGCRHESDATAGSLAFFERIFHLSTVHKSSRQVLQALKALALNTNVQCTVQRECIQYAIEIDAKHTSSTLDAVAEVLAEIVLRPVFDSVEVESTKAEAEADLASLVQNTNLLLDDLTHMTAFGKKTLGRPLFITPEVLRNKISALALRDAHTTWFRPERITFTAVNANVTHKDLELTVRRHFESFAVPPLNARLARNAENNSQPAAFVGGESRLPGSHLSRLTHVRLAFEASAWRDRTASAALAIAASAMLQSSSSSSSSSSLPSSSSSLLSSSSFPPSFLCQPLLSQYSDTAVFGVHCSATALSSSSSSTLTLALQALQRVITLNRTTFQDAQYGALDMLKNRYQDAAFVAAELGHRSHWPADGQLTLDIDAEREHLEACTPDAMRALIVRTMQHSRPCAYLCVGGDVHTAPSLANVRATIQAFL